MKVRAMLEVEIESEEGYTEKDIREGIEEYISDNTELILLGIEDITIIDDESTDEQSDWSDEDWD